MIKLEYGDEKIILDNLCGPNRITTGLVRGRLKVIERSCKNSSRGQMGEEVEEGVTSQGMQTASRNWKQILL